TLCAELAGLPMTFEVKRAEPGQDEAKTVTLTVTPERVPVWTESVRPFEPLEVPGLGLAYHVVGHIDAVAPDSPAAKAGLKPGDTINAMTFLPPEGAKPEEKSDLQPKQIEFKEDSPNWAYAFYVLQVLPRQAVQLTVNHSNKPITLTPEPD